MAGSDVVELTERVCGAAVRSMTGVTQILASIERGDSDAVQGAPPQTKGHSESGRRRVDALEGAPWPQ